MPPTRYRVEHQQPRRTRVIGTLEVASPHFRALDVYLSHLLREGATGWLRLVDDHTGEVVIKRRIQVPWRRKNPSAR